MVWASIFAAATVAPFATGQDLTSSFDGAEPAWYETFTFNLDEVSEPATVFERDEDSMQFEWGGEGRWKLNLDLVTRTDESPLPREEMSAGASFRITPRFSVGGEVMLGADKLDDSVRWREDAVEAGVRVETSFKF